jgi:hypothetical protein
MIFIAEYFHASLIAIKCCFLVMDVARIEDIYTAQCKLWIRYGGLFMMIEASINIWYNIICYI